MMTYKLENLRDVAYWIIRHSPENACIAFFAEMGAGKTTLIAEICRLLGVREQVSSPTFSIINEYRSEAGFTIYHSDWYRLKNAEDAIQAGVQDMLEHTDCYRLIEWPAMAEELLPEGCIKIAIVANDHETRTLYTDPRALNGNS